MASASNKQSTLGKFWELPKNVVPGTRPKDQSSLEGAWAKKEKAKGQVEGNEVDQVGEASGSGSGSGSLLLAGGKDQEEEKGKDESGEDSKMDLDELEPPAVASTSNSKKRSLPSADSDNDIGANGNSTSSSPASKKPKTIPIESSPSGKKESKKVDEHDATDVEMKIADEKDNNVDSDDSDEIKPRSSKPKIKSSSKQDPKPSTSSSSSNPFSLSKPKPKSADKGKSDSKSRGKKSTLVDPDDESEGEGGESSSKVKDEDEEEADGEGANEEDEEEIDDEEEKKEDKAVANKLAITLAQEASRIAPTKWKVGESVPYSALTDTFDLIDKTTKRNQISSYLTHFLLSVAKAPGKDGGDLLRVVYLCINRLCPDYMGLELGMGESLIMKAIAQATGRSLQQIKTDLRKVGDLGLVAEQSRGKQKTLFASKGLTVESVFKTFKDIAQVSGASSQAKKVGLVCKLLTPCNGSETRFIIRSCEGKLRIGLAEKTLVTALAHAVVLKEIGGKNLPPAQIAERLARGAEIVKQVYSELPNYDLIVPALLENGIDKLKDTCKLSPGVPLKPMLAKPTKAIGEVLDRFEGKEFTCEYKYDGERAQIHRLPNGQIVVFSRNSENMSAKYPDLVESIPKAMNSSVKSFVIDSEAVAYDLETKKLLPFQDLTRRKRKDVRTEDITVRVHVFAFDLLYLNGEPLLDKDLKERRQILRDNFHPVEGEFAFAISSDGSSSEQIAEFLDESIKDGCEGLMVKRLTGEDATYEPSRRSINWLKLKKDYLSGVGDSCDLVVVGAYYGKGKRTNVYGAFLLACYDPDSETYQTACKIGTGFSEEQLTELYEKLKPLETTTKRSDISADPSKPPDIWFEPQVLFEVLTADLTLSPIYMAAKGIADARGISLRFPRFIRLRDDKGPDDATTSDAIAEFYSAQATAHKGGGGGGDEY